GKSTVANMLLKDDLYGKKSPMTEDTIVKLSSNLAYGRNKNFKVFIIAELGIFERKKAIQNIRDYFSKNQKGRFIDDDSKKFNEFKDMFNDGDSNIIIIITHCKQKWVNENLKTIRDYFGDYPVIGVDFPSEDEDEGGSNNTYKQRQKEQRVQSLNYLLGRLSALNYKGIQKMVFLAAVSKNEEAKDDGVNLRNFCSMISRANKINVYRIHVLVIPEQRLIGP
ncbi:10158_t:CDS:2, partial [Dentiscutata erythropus]